MQYPGAGPRKDATSCVPGLSGASGHCAMLARLMPLLTLADAELAYGLHPLLDRAALAVRGGERIGLIGRNGTGKSTLLKVIAGDLALDGGEFRRRDGLRIGFVEQEPTLPRRAHAARESRRARSAGRRDDERARWQAESRLVEYLHRFGLDDSLRPDAASGGECKRATLALALALEPQLLLLDEPTNHLDIDGIGLARGPAREGAPRPASSSPTTAPSSTRWRRASSNSIAACCARTRATSRTTSAARTSSSRRRPSPTRRFDKFWAQEEVWIRKGVEARRTRNEGRVRRLEALREQRAARRERLGNVKLTLDAGERSGKLVAELENVTKRLRRAGRRRRRCRSDHARRPPRLHRCRTAPASPRCSSSFSASSRPTPARVRLGTNLQVAYFDQLREQLDPERSVAATVSPTSDWVEVGGERRHVISYLGDFLFAPQRAESPVRMLSGGERNRLLLATLFARPANVLVLDEPTNDLDIESLELLEATLQEYPGTVLLVSHDRRFLDNVVTQTLAAEGDGTLAGVRRRLQRVAGAEADRSRSKPRPRLHGHPRPPKRTKSGPRATATKLSYKESRELAQLPAQIEALETRTAGTERAHEPPRLPPAGHGADQGGWTAPRRDRGRSSRLPSTAGRNSKRAQPRRSAADPIGPGARKKVRPHLTVRAQCVPGTPGGQSGRASACHPLSGRPSSPAPPSRSGVEKWQSSQPLSLP